MKQFNLKSNTKMEKTPTNELFKLLDSKLKFWQDVWLATASSSNVSSKDICTAWADRALEVYESKFNQSIDLTLEVSLRDSEINDLKDRIDFQTNVINEQFELIKKQNKLNDELVKEKKDLEILISDLEESLNAKSIDGAKPNFSGWVAYDFHKIETRPKAYGKYFVCRKDGKVHWETWNGSGWAYNENAITHWKEVDPPSR